MEISNEQRAKNKRMNLGCLIVFILAIIILIFLFRGYTKNNNNTNSETPIQNTTINDTEQNRSEALDTEFTSETICEMIKKEINGDIGKDEFIKDVILITKDLYIYIDFNEVNPEPFTLEDLAVSRTSSITDTILKHKEFDKYWDIITVDFGVTGYIANNKTNIVNDEYGRYFDSSNFKLKLN